MTHGRMEQFDPSRESWTSYEERLTYYFTANDIPDAKKKSILLTVCGSSTYELAKSLAQPESLQSADTDYDKIVKLLQEHYSPTPSPIMQRFRFHSRNRHAGESISTYIAELRSIGEHCGFSDLTEMIRDRLVCGVNDPNIQRRLLEESKLTYKTAVDLAISMEAAAKNTQDLRKTLPSTPVQRLQARKPPNKQRSVTTTTTQRSTKCYRCGEPDHLAPACRWREVTCRTCGKKGHLAKVCRSGRPKGTDKPPQILSIRSPEPPPAFEVEHSSHYTTTAEYTIHSLSNQALPIQISVSVNNCDLLMEVDTGASLSLISEHTYQANFKDLPIQQSDIQLHTYSGEAIPVLGLIKVEVQYQDQHASLQLLVVQGKGPSLFGRDWLMKIRLNWNDIYNVHTLSNSIDRLVCKYPTVFTDELGRLKGMTGTVEIIKDAQPKFLKPRPTSYFLKSKVEAELERLQQKGVISPVAFSPWAAPIVPVLKPDGTVRICGDYKVTINPVAQPDSYPLPRIDDLFAKVSGGSIFSKLDLAHAYHQIALDDKSKELTTINTHKGLFRYNRLPFGISTAPSIFQRTLETLLADVPGVCVYLDDILVSGKDKAEHLESLEKVVARLAEAGLTLKRSKCEFCLSSVSYLGHVIDKDGLHPSPDKVKAIREAPTPTNTSELKAFIGLINYYHKFVSNLSCILSPLYRLLQHQIKWSWTQEQDKAFSRAKDLIQSSSVLVHFDPSKELVVAADASPYGVGAVLSQKMEDNTERPVAFASRTLSAPEKRYAQVEKEALAIIFAVRKFHQYLHGRHFSIQSDHKPLQYLFKESNQIPVMASARVQRWALILGAYSYSISYKPGSQMSHADGLSRLPLPAPQSYSSVPTPNELNHLIHQLSSAIITAAHIRDWTNRDPILSRVRHLVSTGWTITDPDPSISSYHHRRHELSTLDGCLLWGSRVVVPPPGQEIVLQQLHEGHPGVTRMKSLSRGYVWWPQLDKDIERAVQQCKECQLDRPNPPKSPLHPWEYPRRPWSRLHIDHAGPYMGHTFLIVVDSYSKWIDVFPVSSTSTEVTVKCLRSLFAIHGIPEHIVSDNGSSFTSFQFANFMSENGIKHSKSSPYHPSTNGLAERAVQTVKHGIAKMEGTMDCKLARFLLTYRITPQSTTGLSPSELLMGRRLRTCLDLMHPDVCQKVVKKQEKQNSDGKRLRQFKIGDALFARDYSGRQKWIPVVVKSTTGPLSYKVETQNGQIFRRHIDQLRNRYTDDVDPPDDFHFGPSRTPEGSSSVIATDVSIQENDTSTRSHQEPSEVRRSSRTRRPVDRYSPSFSS